MSYLDTGVLHLEDVHNMCTGSTSEQICIADTVLGVLYLEYVHILHIHISMLGSRTYML